MLLSCNPIKIHVTYLPMLSAHNPHKTHPQIDSKALRTILTNLQKNLLLNKILLQIKFVSSPTTQSSKYKKIILSRCIFLAPLPCHRLSKCVFLKSIFQKNILYVTEGLLLKEHIIKIQIKPIDMQIQI